MSLVKVVLIPMLEQEAIRDWEENHYLRSSKAVINGIVSIHKDTNEPCAKNPCYQALRLQDLGVNMENLYDVS